jgi:hypothetical protein
LPKPDSPVPGLNDCVHLNARQIQIHDNAVNAKELLLVAVDEIATVGARKMND